MHEDRSIIFYPDPRLKRISKPVETFDANLADLAKRMFELMRLAKGVGLAAPQVGLNVRLFIVNHTGKPEDDRVYVNPLLSDADGEEIGQEGCLSIPTINIDVPRAKTVRMTAVDLTGKPIELTETGYVARIFQHELDHLNGILLTDRMGPTAKMEFKKKLKEMEDAYAEAHPPKPKKKRTK